METILERIVLGFLGLAAVLGWAYLAGEEDGARDGYARGFKHGHQLALEHGDRRKAGSAATPPAPPNPRAEHRGP